MKEAINSIDVGKMDQLMDVKTAEGEIIEVYMKEKGNDLSEMYLINQGTENFVFAIIWGKLDLVQLAQLGDVLRLPGLKYLGNLPSTE